MNYEMNVYRHERINEVQQLYSEILGKYDQYTIGQYLGMMADMLMDAYTMKRVIACLEISNYHPKFLGWSDDKIFDSSFSSDDARLTIAKEHGYKNWNEVLSMGKSRFNTIFEESVDLFLNGDRNLLEKRLVMTPDIIQMRSKFGHRAHLLHYAGSNGLEIYRQMVPLNLADLISLLREHGADGAAEMYVYEGKYNTLQLVSTSTHPKDAGILEEVIMELTHPAWERSNGS